MSMRRCEHCRFAIRKVRTVTLSPYLCTQGGGAHEPALPVLWIRFSGCPVYEAKSPV